MTKPKKKADPFDGLVLDAEEQAIEDALEFGPADKPHSDPRLEEELRIAARNTLRKSKTISIRLTPGDVDALKQRAAREGMPYQTLISSVLHKYVTGQFE